MMRWIQTLGRKNLDLCSKLGASGILIFRSLIGPRVGFGLMSRQIIRQIYFVGVFSLSISVVSALFIGMVLGLQGYTILSRFGAESALGQLIALSLIRELGPVVTALLFAGRAGSALTAEIGLMKTTEQLSSLEMMGVDPLRRIIAPRFWAGFISLPVLTVIFNVVAIYGGYIVGVQWLGTDAGSFWGHMQDSVHFREDIMNTVYKSVVFGALITWVAVYQGFATEPTSEGISRATTRTVVYSSLIILGMDFLLTAIMFGEF